MSELVDLDTVELFSEFRQITHYTAARKCRVFDRTYTELVTFLDVPDVNLENLEVGSRFLSYESGITYCLMLNDGGHSGWVPIIRVGGRLDDV